MAYSPAPNSPPPPPQASARSGHARWLAERISAAALVPLSLWFVAALIAQSGSDHAAFILWLQAPLTAGAMILLLLALFYHTALGLEVVIEDYIHSGLQTVVVGLVRVSCFGLGAAGILAVLRIALQV